MASAAPRPLVDLPPKLKALHDSLLGEGDVPILDIYANVAGAADGRAPDSVVTPPPRPLREAQQYLGAYITQLNRRLREHGQVVRPGRLKGTYHLTTL